MLSRGSTSTASRSRCSVSPICFPAGTPAWPGVAHNGTYTFPGKDYLVFHAYEAADNGLQKLKIAELHWDTEGWPFVDPSVLSEYTSVLME